MGELVGLPEWLAELLFVAAFLVIIFGYAGFKTRRTWKRTAARRPNPTEAEFFALMQPDVSGEATRFLWDTMAFYTTPELTPHPDDELGEDLCINDDDWSMDWPVEWAKQQGFHESNLPEWPEGWRPTVRNYGRWLSMDLR